MVVVGGGEAGVCSRTANYSSAYITCRHFCPSPPRPGLIIRVNPFRGQNKHGGGSRDATGTSKSLDKPQKIKCPYVTQEPGFSGRLHNR